MTKDTKGWTPERRQAQRERILKNKPWEKSTGPKTTQGKEKSSQNALKTGYRTKELLAIRKYLRDSRRVMEAIYERRFRIDRSPTYKLKSGEMDERTKEIILNWPIPTFKLKDRRNL